MTRKHKKLPVKLRFSILPTLASVIFPTDNIIITSTTHAQQIFGEYHKVMFQRGSYAHITSQTNIVCSNIGININLYYCVKNPQGVIQWGNDINN